MVTLIDLLSNTYSPIQASILSHLSIADVVNLNLTCKGFGQLQPTLMATSYNINRLLGEFVDDPLEFRSLQGNLGALITGDVIRGWFHRSIAPDLHMLEIHVYMEHCDAIINYIEENGYETTSLLKWDEYLLSECRSTNSEHRFLIHGHVNTPLSGIFYDSTFTSDLCFIAWNKAYALFPYTTFIRRECYSLKKAGEFDMRQATLTCVAAGLSVKTVSWAHLDTSFFHDSGLFEILSLSRECEDIKELARRRKVGDEHTWSIELGTKGLEESNIMDTSLESCTFRLYARDFSPPVEPVHYVIGPHTSVLRHYVLRHTYMALTDERERSYYAVRIEALRCRLDELALVELSKMPPEDRPDVYEEIVQDVSNARSHWGSDFVPPNTWTFYDDEVIAFLDKIWKTQQRIDKKEEASRKKQLEALLTESA